VDNFILLQNALDAMEGAMVEDSETCRYERDIRTGISRVQDKLIYALERNIDKFELYVCRNIFRVPDHIDPTLVAASAADSQACSAEDEMRMEEELAALQRKILSAEFVNKAMKQKLAALDEELASYSPVAKILEDAEARAQEFGMEESLPSAVGAILSHESELRAVAKQQAIHEMVNQFDSITLAATISFLIMTKVYPFVEIVALDNDGCTVFCVFLRGRRRKGRRRKRQKPPRRQPTQSTARTAPPWAGPRLGILPSCLVAWRVEPPSCIRAASFLVPHSACLWLMQITFSPFPELILASPLPACSNFRLAFIACLAFPA
jgi:hypothetical protein